MAACKRRLHGIVVAAPAWVGEEILSASEHIGDKRAVLWMSADGRNRVFSEKPGFSTVAFLKARYPTTQPVRKTRRTRLADEPFIGMWRNREDMQDSTAWVRSLRRHEWECNA